MIRALRGYTVAAVVEEEAVGRGNRAADGHVCSRRSSRRSAVRVLRHSEVVDAAEVLEALPGLELPIARLGHLIALKVLSRDDRRRPQDLVDLRALLRRATDDDLPNARRSLRLIIDRGYQRGRSLLAELDALLSV